MHPQMTILETIFGQVNGASIVSIDTMTVPILLGGMKNPHKGRVFKHGIRHNVMVFQNKQTNGYENMVHRRLQQEGKNPQSFELSARQWGQRIPKTPFVEHNDKLYLEVIFLKPGTSYYSLDGVRTDPDFIQGLKLDHEEGEQGGLDNKVIIRTFAFSSIKRVRIDGQEYTIDF